ncbi:hypothetical protein SPRG_12195 [Saprolegnia parasitica CBS 223.65]|uniref:EGF-like domain-containing protein n=1 Tax=Saprolegnia parasitica (strain CBS 223.65) TaxID=695850 RepID=A0A067BWY7_SAPPC|nr:hypothetical protein SPRG_12195 [Saprolegnia parasitica CBS 223.65]KDO22768.1 hypothetical protein SPRG_12195 [Saprolegnia parasitica CBS 223.65]|eukprot:XP_012206552.1 hypothetical protein SPRG_12195 [Saprolegnia parasitica CBS 223.65]
MNMLRACLGIMLVMIHSAVGGHDCGHDELMERFLADVDASTLRSPQNLVSSTSRRLDGDAVASSLFNPIRISFDTSKLFSDPGYLCANVGDVVSRDGSSYTCAPNDVLTSDKRSFITNVLLPAITSYFSKVLSVQSVSGNLVVPGIGCGSNGQWACCTNSMPPYLASTGIAKTDFLIHVTARPTSGAVLAWALPCNLDQYGRPISGQANFGPNRLDASSAARSQQVGTALHEMTHALGFSSSRFPDFRQPLNGAPWGAGNIVSNTLERGVAVSKIITPKVVAAVKQQFNCYNWVNAGGELENGAQGTAATTTSHWEKRLFQNEYMTATASATPVFSALTLALFEDSGWYTANYSMAEALAWGYLEGCTFATAKCSEWSSDYFCRAKGDRCTPTRDAKGYCNIATYTSSIPAGFQYFGNAALGGQDTYADYCPLNAGYSNGGCANLGTYVTPNMGEILSPSSQCFQSTLSTSGTRTSTPVCYRVDRCTKTAMLLTVGTTQVSCPMAGGAVSVPGYSGSLSCPPANAICQRLQNECSGAGVLQTDGSCVCHPGFNGADCSLLNCPTANGATCAGQGTCDGSTGQCTCKPGYTGLACSLLVCPGINDLKYNAAECSNHGTCNAVAGTCTCHAGYSGNACECVPGCPGCGANGSCDCRTGSCVCNSGYYGTSCQTNQMPPITTLELGNATAFQGFVAAKSYQFFRVQLNSSSSDVTVHVVTTRGDADVYASFVTPTPSVGSLRASTFVSDANRTDGIDAITLCGTLGVFPRGINDTFHFCRQPNTQFVQGAPGYLYIGVFGFAASRFTIAVKLNKCSSESCSNHGSCGKYYAGVCACDRYWTGDACNLPQCRPDCVDFDNCPVPGSSTPVGVVSKGLRSTTDCYGNGVCTVQTNADGVDQPTCVCDPAYHYDRPNDAQSLCKVPIPSISYVEHYNSSFVVYAQSLDEQVDIGQWALYTINVQPSWNYVHVQLDAASLTSDALVLVRKNTLPSLDVTHPYPVQAADAHAWASQAGTQRILLTRAASTLSDGLLYIGVYNTLYARSSLAFSLNVQANSSCVNASRVCPAATSTCSPALDGLCACATGYGGAFCDRGPIAHRRVWHNASAINISIQLHPGKWTYLTLDVPDPDVAFIKVQLSNIDDAMPLLLVRGPLETGLPALDLGASFDFDGMAAGATSQTVVVPVSTACSGPTCYKIAVYNKRFAADILHAQLLVQPLAALSEVYPSSTCGGNGDVTLCGGRGTCLDSKDGPSCSCKNGWHGLTCESPNPMDMGALWYASENASLLCSVCTSTFSLPNDGGALFTLPQSMQPNTGIQLRVTNLDGVSPSVYVAEVPPRSIYDFSLVSFSNGTEEVVQLLNEPLSGQFWVLVYSEAPIAMSTSNASVYSRFQIAASLVARNGSSAANASITASGFLPSVMQWLTTTPAGITVFTMLLIFLALVVGFFVYRIFRSPDNQDGAIRSIAHDIPVSSRPVVPSPATEAPDSPLHNAGRNESASDGGRRRSIDIELAEHPHLAQL